MSDRGKCPTCGSEDTVISAVYRSTIDDLRRQLADLRAVADKLPKIWRLNEAGELVQDVPVAPTDVVWLPTGFGEAAPRPVLTFSKINDREWALTLMYPTGGIFIDYAYHCSSTKEAALAIRKKKS